MNPIQRNFDDGSRGPFGGRRGGHHRHPGDQGHGHGHGGPFAGPFGGPGGRGRGRGEGRGAWEGRRGRRGDVRAAILALLAERPMHGYEMLQELSARTDDLWRPSPGSLYPALSYLEDQGLVTAVEADGRRRFELTDAGRTEQSSRSGPPPWETVRGGADSDDVALGATLRQVAVAVGQVAQAGSPEHKAAANGLLTELRRQLYLLLADAPVPTPGPAPAEPATDA
jgi:DNA-binding transcriptional ArsR family regulator